MTAFSISNPERCNLNFFFKEKTNQTKKLASRRSLQFLIKKHNLLGKNYING
jgi:hypothetical protein